MPDVKYGQIGFERPYTRCVGPLFKGHWLPSRLSLTKTSCQRCPALCFLFWGAFKFVFFPRCPCAYVPATVSPLSRHCPTSLCLHQTYPHHLFYSPLLPSHLSPTTLSLSPLSSSLYLLCYESLDDGRMTLFHQCNFWKGQFCSNIVGDF
jgi:hypothetical protein